MCGLPSAGAGNDAEADFNFASYEPSTFRAIRETYKRRPDDPSSGLHLSTGIKYRVSATYAGTVRPLAPETERLLDVFSRIRGYPNLLSHFSKEVLFSENGESIWLPTQTVLLEHLERELRPGSPVDLYVMYLGEAKGRWYFIVNEFQAIP